jgi:enoyl-CoA hydratase/carnithine racemase
VEDATGVRVDRDGPVTAVTIDRPERRNPVDPAAAHQAGAGRLPRVVGHGRAMDLLLPSRPRARRASP